MLTLTLTLGAVKMFDRGGCWICRTWKCRTTKKQWLEIATPGKWRTKSHPWNSCFWVPWEPVRAAVLFCPILCVLTTYWVPASHTCTGCTGITEAPTAAAWETDRRRHCVHGAGIACFTGHHQHETPHRRSYNFCFSPAAPKPLNQRLYCSMVAAHARCVSAPTCSHSLYCTSVRAVLYRVYRLRQIKWWWLYIAANLLNKA